VVSASRNDVGDRLRPSSHFRLRKRLAQRDGDDSLSLSNRDCVVILNADRKSSVILEAARSQIPIASLGDSTIPWQSYSRTTYTIPSGASIGFLYFFCHSVMKTVIMEQLSSIFVDGTSSVCVTKQLAFCHGSS
jgi:hypothetical protein